MGYDLRAAVTSVEATSLHPHYRRVDHGFLACSKCPSSVRPGIRNRWPSSGLFGGTTAAASAVGAGVPPCQPVLPGFANGSAYQREDVVGIYPALDYDSPTSSSPLHTGDLAVVSSA
ncbi:hypothetical protein VTI28DRAFT_3601 [Corynascus sepedonium]